MNPAGRLLVGAAVGLVVVALVRETMTVPLLGWQALGTVLIAGACAVAIAPFGSLIRTPGIVPVAIGGWLAAVYACVPETDQVIPIAAWVAAGVMMELVWSKRLPWAAHLALAAMVLWAGVYGATGQGRALVGAWFGAWGLMVGPLAAWLFPGVRYASAVVRWIMAATGGIAALVVSRTGALRPPTEGAIRAAIAGGVLSAGASVAIASIVLLATRCGRGNASERQTVR